MGSMPGPKNPKAERARIGDVPPRLPPGESRESPAATEQRCEGGGLGFAEARRRGGWRMRKDGWIGGAAPCGWVGDRAEKQSKVLKWQPPFTAFCFCFSLAFRTSACGIRSLVFSRCEVIGQDDMERLMTSGVYVSGGPHVGGGE